MEDINHYVFVISSFVILLELIRSTQTAGCSLILVVSEGRMLYKRWASAINEPCLINNNTCALNYNSLPSIITGLTSITIVTLTLTVYCHLLCTLQLLLVNISLPNVLLTFHLM